MCFLRLRRGGQVLGDVCRNWRRREGRGRRVGVVGRVGIGIENVGVVVGGMFGLLDLKSIAELHLQESIVGLVDVIVGQRGFDKKSSRMIVTRQED